MRKPPQARKQSSLVGKKDKNTSRAYETECHNQSIDDKESEEMNRKATNRLINIQSLHHGLGISGKSAKSATNHGNRAMGSYNTDFHEKDKADTATKEAACAEAIRERFVSKESERQSKDIIKGIPLVTPDNPSKDMANMNSFKGTLLTNSLAGTHGGNTHMKTSTHNLHDRIHASYSISSKHNGNMTSLQGATAHPHGILQPKTLSEI